MEGRLKRNSFIKPLSNPEKILALVFSSGSAFRLNASSGAIKYLEEKNIGYQTYFAKVPLVCISCIYDLGYKSSKIKPDEKMGYDACLDSEKNIIKEGNISAGCGATVGKLNGMDQCQKAGLGIYAVEIGGIKVVAIFNGKREK